MEWVTEKRKVSELVPYGNNPRTLTETQSADLKKSIEKFNLVEIPAINIDGTILAGHQRLKIMCLIGRGEEYVDVRVPTVALTQEEVREYNIRSNKNTGEFDFGVLARCFDADSLKEWGFTEADLNKIDFGGESFSGPEFSDGTTEKCSFSVVFFESDKEAITSILRDMTGNFKGFNYYE